MFFSLSAIIGFFFTLFLVGQAAAGPIPMPMVAAVEGSVLKRQTPDVQTPSKSDGSVITTYPKRQTPDAQTPSKSDGNVITAYPKRQTPDVQTPSKSDGSVITTYPKRQTPDVQSPSKSDGSIIVSYPRSGDIPSQLAVRSVDGIIELY